MVEVESSVLAVIPSSARFIRRRDSVMCEIPGFETTSTAVQNSAFMKVNATGRFGNQTCQN